MSWGAIGGAAIGTAGSLIGGGGQSVKGAGHSAWKPGLQAIKDNVLPGVNAFGSQFGQGQGLWSGSQLGAQDANVMGGQNAQLQAAGLFGNQMQGVNSTLEGFLDYDPNSFQNQASRDALSSNISSMFNESIRPGIEDRGTFSGQFGGPQQSIALGAATAPLSRAMADAEVNLMNADRQRAMAAMGMAPNIYQQGFVPGMLQQQVGDQRTQRNQLEQMDAIQMFEADRNNMLRGVQDASGITNSLAWGGSPTVSQSGGGNIAQGALGGAMLGSQLGSLFGGNAGNGFRGDPLWNSDFSAGAGGAFDGSF